MTSMKTQKSCVGNISSLSLLLSAVVFLLFSSSFSSFSPLLSLPLLLSQQGYHFCLAPKQMAVLVYQTQESHLQTNAGAAAGVIFWNTSPITKAFILSSVQHGSSGQDLQQPRTYGIFCYPEMIGGPRCSSAIILKNKTKTLLWNLAPWFFQTLQTKGKPL